jgi:hypothetical protein
MNELLVGYALADVSQATGTGAAIRTFRTFSGVTAPADQPRREGFVSITASQQPGWPRCVTRHQAREGRGRGGAARVSRCDPTAYERRGGPGPLRGRADRPRRKRVRHQLAVAERHLASLTCSGAVRVAPGEGSPSRSCHDSTGFAAERESAGQCTPPSPCSPDGRGCRCVERLP